MLKCFKKNGLLKDFYFQFYSLELELIDIEF